MIDSVLWSQGVTIQTYISNSPHFQKELMERVRDVRLTPFEKERLKSVPTVFKVVVMTETWCSDSLMNVPILAKIEEVCPKLEVRVFPRNQFEALNQFFIHSGYPQIPVFWFMDEDFQPLGVWMERPTGADRKIKRWKADNPAFDAIKNDTSLSSEDRKLKLKPYIDALVDEMWNWYDTGLQSETISDIFSIMGLK